MTEQLKRDFETALLNNTFYDFISNHGWEISQNELIDIIKELDYCLHQNHIYDCELLSSDYYINDMIK